MHSDPVTIYCSNHLCQTPNPESHRFCQQCRTLLPKRYLWAIGQEATLQPGERLAGRYAVKQGGIVLDTQPGLLPEMPHEIPAGIEPYLRLAAYQLHVPQAYGVVASSQKQGSDLLLLEQAPLYTEGVGGSVAEESLSAPTLSSDGQAEAQTLRDRPFKSLEGQLMPALTTAWKQSSALRQLNWLWQIAHLWEPLASEGVASTLLVPELLRVEGALVRLLALQFDDQTATLVALGRLWQQWQPSAQPAIAPFLAQLCQLMQQGQIRNAEQLVTLLDRALASAGRSQSRQVQLATLTDQGPSRQRNEDACYPPSGTVSAVDPSQRSPLVLVCDGIGGHEGGNVASNLAIDTVQQQLQSLPSPDRATEPTVLMLQLEQAALVANDVISQRNDHEQRQERQRMGTTLVTALAYGHEMYLTHVGDSRIYRITRLGCHQVTLDDDLAAREVRLGYAFYREALQQPGSGSLVQALGMNASTLLHPTVQRFVMDEDCLFLLCSDGLSDNDRVDEYWHELIPILDGKLDVATASQRLLTIANTKNGHDNVTIGLVYCQVTPASPSSTTPLQVSLDVPDLGAINPAIGSAHVPPAVKTRILPTRRTTNPFLVLLSLVLVVGLGSVFAYVLLPPVREWTDSLLGLRSSPLTEPTASVPASTPDVIPSGAVSSGSPEALSVGSLIQVQRSTAESTPAGVIKPLTLWSQPELQTLPKSARIGLGTIPVGSVLQILSRQAIPNRGYWLKLKVCSIPSPLGASVPPTASPTATVQPGITGWTEQTAIAPIVTQNLGLKPAQLGACTIPTSLSTVSPVPAVKSSGE